MENNPNISGWIQMVFGGQTPNLTYPEYTIVKEDQNTPYTSPDVLKTLFYGQQPLQIQKVEKVTERKQEKLQFAIVNRSAPFNSTQHFFCFQDQPPLHVPYFYVSHQLNGIISQADVLINQRSVRFNGYLV